MGCTYLPVLIHFGDTLTLGRFRWVALQLDAASRCRSLNTLRQALSSLPRSLDDTYRRILESIEEREQGHVRRILQWLCFSKRPLRLEEIAVIYEIADRVQPPFVHEDGLFHHEDIIDICRGLLSLSFSYTSIWDDKWHNFPPYKTLRIVQLAHFSVKEYLFSSLSSPWTIDEHLSHVTILKSAIAYYLHFMTLRDIQSLSVPELVLEYSLAEYFSKYLPEHLTPIREHSDLLPSLRLLLHPPSTPIATKLGHILLDQCKSDDWQCKSYDSECESDDWEWRRRKPRVDELVACDPATNLCLAIRLRLPQVCQSLLAMNVQLDLVSPLYSRHPSPVGDPPLVEAVRYGATQEIIQLLLDVRARHHYNGLHPLADGSALEEAVKKCNTRVVQMLLDAADDIRETASRFGKSLPLAVSQGNKDLINALLDAGADLNASDDNGTAVLVSASRAGNAEIVRTLVEAGANVNISNGDAIYEASAAGHEGVVRVLTEAGADVNLECYGGTTLGVALRRGYLNIVKILLDAGADVNAANGQALREASYREHEEVAQFLIEAGAAVNMKYNGETPLGVASRRGCMKLVKVLLDAGADVDAANGQALREASYGEHEEVLRFLIEAGAAVNMKYNGETTLGVASRRGCMKIVKILLDGGADVDAANGQALHEASYWGHEEVVHFLIEADAAVNMEHNGETALGIASRCGYTKIVKILLHAGVDVDAANGQALHGASYWGREEVVHFLIEAGAAVNMEYNGETSLGAASRCGCMKIAKILLDAGADVNAMGGWALYAASERGHEEVVHILLEAGADVTMKHTGETALEVALRRGHAKIFQMLLAAEATPGNRSRTQNYTYPSCMVDEDDYDYAYANDDSENSEGEGEGEKEEDDEWEETETDDDDERDDTDMVEDNERKEMEVENGSKKEDRGRKRKRRNSESDETSKKRRLKVWVRK
jgi:ankyrin repeat protein